MRRLILIGAVTSMVCLTGCGGSNTASTSTTTATAPITPPVTTTVAPPPPPAAPAFSKAELVAINNVKTVAVQAQDYLNNNQTSYKGFVAQLPQIVSSNKKAYQGVLRMSAAQATPGKTANPNVILVTNTAQQGAVSKGTPPRKSKMVVCSVSKGRSWYCARVSAYFVGKPTTYKSGKGQMTDGDLHGKFVSNPGWITASE